MRDPVVRRAETGFLYGKIVALAHEMVSGMEGISTVLAA